MRFFVTCARGTEGPLRRELVDLRIRGPRGAEGGVSFEGRLQEALAVCLHSRVAMRVLLELGAGPADSADELYEGVRAFDWSQHLTTKSTFAVSATVRDNPALSHSGFAALKVKDAIVDSLRDRLGARPDVNPEDPDVPVVLHLRGSEARLFLDLSGQPLHRRGYRLAMTDAPLKENLAAAVLALAGASPELPFLDPMAGSGTFAIEQALRARKIAPGIARSFAAERWPDPTAATTLAELRTQARAAQLERAPAPIIARDIDRNATTAAQRNAAAAGVDADIRFETGPARALQPPFPAGTLLTNPPYGERLPPDPRALELVYEELSAALGRFPTWTLAVLSGNPMFSRIFLRKPAINHRLFNGPLETRLLVYRPR
jgi:23S rRNA G2445 N2-methylase RlmL